MQRRAKPPSRPLGAERIDDLAGIVTVWILSACLIYNETFGDNRILDMGSISLTTGDIVLLASLSCFAVLLANTTIRITAISAIVLSLMAITIAAFLRGFAVSAYDALFAVRSSGIFPALLGVSLLLPQEGRIYGQMRHAVLVTGLILVGLVGLRLVFGANFLMTDELVREFNVNDDGRALSSAGALWLAFGAIFAAERVAGPRHMAQGRMKPAFLLAILCAGLIASGQGTANAAGFLAILVVLATAPGPFRDVRMLGLGTVALAVFLAATAAGLSSFGTLSEVLPASLETWLFRRAGNLEVRQFIWTALMSDFDTWPWTWQAFGLPMGVRPVLLLPIWGGYFWEASIHSMYYGYLVVTGVVGVALYVILLGLLALGNFVRLAATPANPLMPGPSVGLALTALCIVFGYSYDLRNEQGLMLGLAIVAATRQTAPRRRPHASSLRAGEPPLHLERRAKL